MSPCLQDILCSCDIKQMELSGPFSNPAASGRARLSAPTASSDAIYKPVLDDD